MKKIYKYILLTILSTGTLFYSCETVELEELASPNSLSPTQADVDLLLNSIQLNYFGSMSGFNNTGADLGRIDYMGGRNYFNNYGSGTVQGQWNNLYTGMLPDIAAIQEQHSAENDLSFHLGVSKIMQGHLMLSLVDFLGDIVYTEATQPGEFPTPNLDDDQAVYTAALGVIDEGIAYLNTIADDNTIASGVTDLFYGGTDGSSPNTSKWVKLANTIKMKANLTTGNYAAVISATDVISSTDDDMQFSFGTNELSPDNRHGDYRADYRSDGANIYQSHWLIDIMVSPMGDEDAEGSTDPRRRYYFYRQTWRSPNNYSLFEDVNGAFGPAGSVYTSTGGANAETLECSGLTTPPHLEFTPGEEIWCSLPLGYWGRSHGNDEGTPPDGFLRTASGVYPAGGSFDGRADAFPYVGDSPTATFGQAVGLGNGGGGAGVEPIILASYVEFWRAEANLMLGNTAAASANIENALEMSIAKVMSFGALDGSANFDEAPDEDTVDAFITRILDEFDAAPEMGSALDANGFPVEQDQMDILSEQFFITMFGGGADAFNFVRRTGYPRTMARSWDPNPGTYPRTVLYPGNEVGANPNILQRTDLNTKVFWDAGATSPAN